MALSSLFVYSIFLSLAYVLKGEGSLRYVPFSAHVPSCKHIACVLIVCPAPRPVGRMQEQGIGMNQSATGLTEPSINQLNPWRATHSKETEEDTETRQSLLRQDQTSQDRMRALDDRSLVDRERERERERGKERHFSKRRSQ